MWATQNRNIKKGASRPLWKDIVLAMVAALLVFVLAVTAYTYYRRDRTLIFEPIDYYTYAESNAPEEATEAWLEGYLSQYTQAYVPRRRRLQSFEVQQVDVVRAGARPVVRADFTLIPAWAEENEFLEWGEVQPDGTVHCSWTMEMEIEATEGTAYMVSWYTAYSPDHPLAAGPYDGKSMWPKRMFQ